MTSERAIMNFGKFRETELNVYNRTVNNFNIAFDLNLLKYVISDTPNVYKIRDYHNISIPGQELLKSLVNELTAFEKEFYQGKSLNDIADRIGENIEVVEKYVKKRTFSKDGLLYSEGPITSVSPNDFDKDSKVWHLSSFLILKDIQLGERFDKLKGIM